MPLIHLWNKDMTGTECGSTNRVDHTVDIVSLLDLKSVDCPVCLEAYQKEREASILDAGFFPSLRQKKVQTKYSVRIEANYFVDNDLVFDDIKRKTIALSEFAKSIGLVVTDESTVFQGKAEY